MKSLCYLFCLIMLLGSPFAYAANCDNPQTSEETAECVGKDLRDADENINISYKNLIASLNEADALTTRKAQRAWIANRDSSCQIDNKAANREDWYHALLADYAKAVCVTAFTRQRNKELELMLANLSAPKTEQPKIPVATPAEVVKAPVATPVAAPSQWSNMSIVYDKPQPTSHTTGKWYFEIAVDYAESIKIEPALLTFGVLIEGKNMIGVLDNIRMRDKDKIPMRYGFAVDLDNGKFYSSRNGVWVDGEPGSNTGKDIKLGKSYYAAIISSADSLEPYFRQKAITANFGTTSMAYSMPAGYIPWQTAP